ncbi:MAG: tetratricopeptide repeat protein, partial [Myxococcota bacterium]
IRARALFLKAIGAWEQLGDPLAAARARMAFARAQIALRQVSDARLQLELAVPAVERAGDHDALGWLYEELAAVLRDTDPPAALDRARAAVQCAAKAGDRPRVGIRLGVVSGLYAATGNWAKARQYQEKALEYLRESHDGLGICAGLDRLAEAAVALGEPDRAEALLREAVELADSLRKPGLQGQLRRRLADRILARGDALAARDLLDRAITLLHTAGDPRESYPAALSLARAHWRLGRRPDAVRALDRAIALCRILGDEDGAAKVTAMRAEAALGEWRG